MRQSARRTVRPFATQDAGDAKVMSLFDSDGRLQLDDPSQYAVLRALSIAAEDRDAMATQCCPGHLLAGLIAAVREEPPATQDDHQSVLSVLERGARKHCSVEELEELVKSFVREPGIIAPRLDLADASFSDSALDALRAAVEAHGGAEGETASRQPALPLWMSVLRVCRREHADLENVLDFDLVLSALDRLHRGTPPVRAIARNGDLVSELFTDSAMDMLHDAARLAARLGYDRLLPAHVAVALLQSPYGAVLDLLRVHCGADGEPSRVGDLLVMMLERPGREQRDPLPLKKAFMARALQDGLTDACREAQMLGLEKAGQQLVFWALLHEARRDGFLRRALKDALAGLDYDRLVREVYQAACENDESEVKPLVLQGLAGTSMQARDLTYEAQVGERRCGGEGQDDLIEAALRGLHRRTGNNVLVVGETGVGKTTLVEELARRDTPFLRGKRIVLVDCEGVPLSAVRQCWMRLLESVKGRSDVIVCVDHFEKLLRTADSQDPSNVPAIRYALDVGAITVIAIIDARHFRELLAAEHRLLELFTVVEAPEVSADETKAILERRVAPELAEAFDVIIEEEAIEKAVQTSASFLISERFPRKAIRLLRDACEHVAFEREVQGKEARTVGLGEVVAAVSAKTGLPPETIAGVGSAVDFSRILSASVLGQPEAVEAAADRLGLIRAGAVSPAKPAAVFLFAGPTGTGKSELGKAMAQVYSTSHRLLRHDMSRFALEHSMQGLFGVPPGYVGYEQGGQLINELNADPFSVVLFDEAEKADPAIWQGMLTLFDEGWVVDQRNVKAYGNHAIFVLTSNAGQEMIRMRYSPGMPQDELDELKRDVQQSLVDYVNPRTGKQPFSPEFIGRITEVVIFGPLDSVAIEGITRLQVNVLRTRWRSSRAKELIVDEGVVRAVAEESHRENLESRGAKGGRIVLSRVTKDIEAPAVRLMERNPERFQASAGIRVILREGGSAAQFIGDDDLDLGAEAALAIRELERMGAPQYLSAMESEVSEWRQAILGLQTRTKRTSVSADLDAALGEARAALLDGGTCLDRRVREARKALIKYVESHFVETPLGGGTA